MTCTCQVSVTRHRRDNIFAKSVEEVKIYNTFLSLPIHVENLKLASSSPNCCFPDAAVEFTSNAFPLRI